MQPTLLSILIISLGISLCACKSTYENIRDDNDIVSAPAGIYRGIVDETSGTISYKGIRYAQPPVEELRWKAPQPIDRSTDTILCDAFGPSAIQRPPAPFGPWSSEYLIPSAPIDEDCLSLNIWRPKETIEPLPVMVWIYGGGFTSGGSAVPLYDGSALAQQDIIVVSINYRVGVLGFLAHPELTAEAGQSGNYGLLDQVAALRWINENISAFGGDTDRITIAGQSAGSMSVHAMVSTPLTAGLFQQAIPQSGANFTHPMMHLSEAEQLGLTVMHELGAENLHDLRALPAEALLPYTERVNRPIIEGHLLPYSTAEIYDRQEQQKVKLLTGWNEHEYMMFAPVVSAEIYQKNIKAHYGDQSQKLLKHYPATNDAVAAQSQKELSRDQIFGVQIYDWAERHAATQEEPVFVYRFAHITPASGEYAQYEAYHSGELPFMFDNVDRYVSRDCGAAEDELAKIMSSYWVNFIKTGNPNGQNLPIWPAYTTENQEIMWIDHGATSKPLTNPEQLSTLRSALSAIAKK